MQTIKIKASKNYNVVIDNNFNNLAQKVKNVFNGKKILLLSDSNVFAIYGNQVKNSLCDFNVIEYVIDAGEQSKNAHTYIKIINFLAENQFTRDSLVFALGGGVVGDIAGFVAATYMRGIKLIQCPTTLLSCVDSSVGGKTGVNLESGKNLLGCFYQPSLVFINVKTLLSLPKEQLLNGMGEICKYAFLSKKIDKEMLKEENREKLIEVCIKIKAQIIHKDEFEKGKRMLLNLGHTIGHAIENLSNYTIPHGICVAKGIEKIIDVSQKFYNISQEKVNKLKELLNLFCFDLSINYTNQQIKEKVILDKKARANSINFVLIKDIAKVKIEKISIDKLGELLQWFIHFRHLMLMAI